MQRLEVSGAVRPIYGSLGIKWLIVRTLNIATVYCHVFKFHIVSTVLMCYVPAKDKPSGWTRTFDLGRQIAA